MIFYRTVALQFDLMVEQKKLNFLIVVSLRTDFSTVPNEYKFISYQSQKIISVYS